MEDDLQALQERIERLLQGVRRLADENRRLKAELVESREARQRMERRMSEARTRVEAVLSRLPAVGEDLRDGAH
jgi:cell division protein ZapB